MNKISYLQETIEDDSLSYAELITNIKENKRESISEGIKDIEDDEIKDEFYDRGVTLLARVDTKDFQEFTNLCSSITQKNISFRKAVKKLQKKTIYAGEHALTFSNMFGVCALMSITKGYDGGFEDTLRFMSEEGTTLQKIGNDNEFQSIKYADKRIDTRTIGNHNITNKLSNGEEVTIEREGGQSRITISDDKAVLERISYSNVLEQFEYKKQIHLGEYKITKNNSLKDGYKLIIEKFIPQVGVGEKNNAISDSPAKIQQTTHQSKRIEDTEQYDVTIDIKDVIKDSELGDFGEYKKLHLISPQEKIRITGDDGSSGVLDCSNFADAKERTYNDYINKLKVTQNEMIDYTTIIYNGEPYRVLAVKSGNKIGLFAGNTEKLKRLYKIMKETERLGNDIESIKGEVANANASLNNIEKRITNIEIGNTCSDIRVYSNFKIDAQTNEDGSVSLYSKKHNTSKTIKNTPTILVDLIGEAVQLGYEWVSYNEIDKTITINIGNEKKVILITSATKMKKLIEQIEEK